MAGRWRRFAVLARVRRRFICRALCSRLIRHQRDGNNAVTQYGITQPRSPPYLGLHRCRGATRIRLRDKRGKRVRDLFLPLNATCSLWGGASSEATRVSQFSSFSFSATDNIRRFLDSAAAAAPSPPERVFTLSTGESERSRVWVNIKQSTTETMRSLPTFSGHEMRLQSGLNYNYQTTHCTRAECVSFKAQR